MHLKKYSHLDKKFVYTAVYTHNKTKVKTIAV